MVHQSAAMPLTSCQVSFTSASSRADRACLERAWRSQPANGRLRDTVGAGQLCLRGALREALHGLTALMGCERRRATEAHALRLRAVAPGAGSGKDQLALTVLPRDPHAHHLDRAARRPCSNPAPARPAVAAARR